MSASKPKTRRATFYFTSWDGIGVHKTEINLLGHGVHLPGNSAKSRPGPFVQFKVKGTRKIHVISGMRNPFFLILDGWGHPEPEDPFIPVPGHPNVTESRYDSHDPKYLIDFNIEIAPHLALETTKIVADYRTNLLTHNQQLAAQ